MAVLLVAQTFCRIRVRHEIVKVTELKLNCRSVQVGTSTILVLLFDCFPVVSFGENVSLTTWTQARLPTCNLTGT